MKNESQIPTWHSVRFSGTTENFLSVKASIINHTAKIHLQGILVRQQIMPPPLHTETSSTYDDLTFKLKNCAFLENLGHEKHTISSFLSQKKNDGIAKEKSEKIVQ